MIYKFLILSDEVDNFVREIEINSDATFLKLNNAILASVKYQTDQITSFFHCMNGWEKHEEITLIEMDNNPEIDTYVMEHTHLDEFVNEEGDRLIFVFDNLTERSFFIELKEILPGTIEMATCTKSQGKAPKQITSEDEFLFNTDSKNGKATTLLDDDFYGDSEFDIDELDADGFGDVGLDELGENF